MKVAAGVLDRRGSIKAHAHPSARAVVGSERGAILPDERRTSGSEYITSNKQQFASNTVAPSEPTPKESGMTAGAVLNRRGSVKAHA